jgi:menaquinone-dependent protoporphyrinogen IX oxidase
MMKKLIIYKSQSGFTEKYAKWLAEELNCQAITLKEAKKVNLQEFDLVLYGGGVHASIISGLKEFKQLSDGRNKKIIFFCTGATPAEELKIIENIKTANFNSEERDNIPFFYLQSGLNYEKLGGPQKIMMKMFAKMLAKKENKTEEEKAMAEVIKDSYDISDKKYIQPIIALVKDMEESK